MNAPEAAGRRSWPAARVEARLPRTTEQRLRVGAVALAGLGILGLFAELALQRHWSNTLQLIAWGSVSVLAVSAILVARTRSPRVVAIARLLAGVGVILGGVGMGVHVWANYEAAPLDYRFTASWPTTPEPIRWLLAATNTVGPAPALVPGAISFMALALLLGTVGHPAFAPRVVAVMATDAIGEAGAGKAEFGGLPGPGGSPERGAVVQTIASGPPGRMTRDDPA